MSGLDLDAIEADLARYDKAIGPGGEKAWTAGHLVQHVRPLVAEIRLYKPLAWANGEALYVHDCNNIEWWHEATQGPINEQGCDACEASPYPGGWQPVYVRRADG